jgi:predicted nucleotide-binding protein
MDEAQKQELIGELQAFCRELKAYKRQLDPKKELSEAQERYRESLREKLLRKMGKLKGILIELTGKQYYTILGDTREFWSEGLTSTGYQPSILTALGFCIDTTNEAIGKLDTTPLTEPRPQGVSMEKSPKAFIAHGGRSGILDKLRDFVEALGIKPVIVELSPTRGMTVDAKVEKYIKDADCGIVLATKGGIVDIKGVKKGAKPKQHPRLNVIDELERLRAAFPEKTILLLERGVDLPSNISGLTHEPFVGQSMDRAFTAIARELTAFGILKAVKP